MAIRSNALIANYLALYNAAVLWFPGIDVMVILEEQELRACLGAADADYCQRVPRFFPKFTFI
jgi:protein-S-isoprenylcysteine O-methyltransferase Ste14